MKFIPLYERVLVKVMDEPRKVGEFDLPDNAREDCLIGTVLAVGDGYRKENGEIVPLLVQKDWIVVFGQYAGSKVRINGVEYLEMREGEIHGRLVLPPASPTSPESEERVHRRPNPSSPD